MKKTAGHTEKIKGIIGITSLGCAKNFVETELAAASFLKAGYGLAGTEGGETVRYINTCAFLKSAREEAFAHIREGEEWKKKKKGRVLCVGGCLLSHTPAETLKKEFPGVDLWIGIDDTVKTGEYLAGFQQKNVGRAPSRTKNYIYNHITPRLQLTPSHYAYLKISDGCDNCCTYCLIPSIRGKLRSRPEDSIVQEAKSLLANGVRELIVIAQDTSAYGRDWDGKRHLGSLLRKLDALEGDYLIRLMYLHPAGIHAELVKVLKGMKHLIPCLEMPVQHIADHVLREMNRKIFEEDTKKAVRMLKEAGFALRTTFMTGFPGETEEDFRDLCEFAEEIRFERLGVFAYSPEAGTPAAELPRKPSRRTAEKRRDLLLEKQSAISREHNEELIGKSMEIIIDGQEEPGVWYGRTVFDAPDIDNLVYMETEKKLSPGMRVTGKILKASEYDLLAEIISSPERKKTVGKNNHK